MKRKINKDKLITFIFIIIGIVLLFIIGCKVYGDFFNKENVSKPIKRLDLYGYSLEKDDTDLYKKNFNELKEILNSKEINFEKYAELLAYLYVIDFYTLSNKISSTDVGSLEFILPSLKENFKLNASDTMYKYIEVNFNGKRTQKLPEVSEISMEEIEEIVYIVDKKEYDGYKIKCIWKYHEDLGYETTSEIKIIKDSSKLYIVESD